MKIKADKHSAHSPTPPAQSREALFMNIMEQSRGVITKVCYMYARSAEDFKELFQEVQINIWQGLDHFRGDSTMTTWVYRVSINTCITCYRRDRKHSGVMALDNDSMSRLADIATDDQEHARCLKEMYGLINRLPALDRAIVLMWLDEKSYAEIAEVTGLTRQAVASRLNRCKTRLTHMSNT